MTLKTGICSVSKKPFKTRNSIIPEKCYYHRNKSRETLMSPELIRDGYYCELAIKTVKGIRKL